MGCGLIRGVLAGAGVPIISVTPAKWKKHFSLNSDAEKSRALAIRRFPTAPLARKKDHGRAEALLMALWKLETDDPVSPRENEESMSFDYPSRSENPTRRHRARQSKFINVTAQAHKDLLSVPSSAT